MEKKIWTRLIVVASLRRDFLSVTGTLARFAPRLAELHFGLRLGRRSERSPQGLLDAALRLLLAVLVINRFFVHGRNIYHGASTTETV